MLIVINRKSAEALWLLITITIECITINIYRILMIKKPFYSIFKGNLMHMHSMFIEINSQSAAALFLLIPMNIECIFNY